jgi:hypothetical protein
MPIKAIVCDMDGTLLTADHAISPKTQELLLSLQQQGITLILASGRSYLRLMPDALKLKMDSHQGYLIDVNGSSIYDFHSQTRERLGIMDSEDIQKITATFSLFNVEIQFSQDAGLYTYLPESLYDLKKKIRGEMRLPDDYPWASGMYGWLCDMRDGYPEQKLILDLKDAPASYNKISISQDPHFMEAVTQSLPHLGLHDAYELVISDERKLEITKKGISKGNALDALLEKLGLSNEEVAVFGDSENDISMLAGRPYSFAMDNALPNAKSAAKYTTPSNDEEGVYHGLTKLIAEGLL